jgi:methionyl-tRNA synthetase|tara:strand:+ start:333 stop:455 length:123 start_codon:yes stop_codon:yes gene_type:complete
MSTILNTGINIVGNIGIISNPFLPFTSKKICSILKLENYY